MFVKAFNTLPVVMVVQEVLRLLGLKKADFLQQPPPKGDHAARHRVSGLFEQLWTP